jgi:UDP-N-acetyl-D-galactosamine dehydrogenase
VVILGLTFKENCPDIRNTKVIDIVHELREYGIDPLVHDPVADPEEAKMVYGLKLLKDLPASVDAVIIAVAHKEYAEMGPQAVMDMLTPDRGVVVDVKSLFSAKDFSDPHIRYWRL